MKKLLFSLLGLFVVLLGGWLGASWWIGKQTETFVREQLTKPQENSVLPAGLKQEVVSYERSLLSSTAVTKLVLDNPLLKSMAEEIQLKHHIQHGPILLGNGIYLGSSNWTTTLDTSKLPEASQNWLKEAFANKEPGKLQTAIGFGGNANYHFQLNPLTSNGGADGVNLKITDLVTDGDIKPKGEMSPGTFSMKGFELRDNNVTFTIPEVKAEGKTDVHSSLGLGNVDIKAPNVQILTAGSTEPISLDMTATTDIREVAKSLQGNLAFNANNVKGPGAEVKSAALKVDYSGFNMDGLLEMQKLQEKLQNLQSQMLWNEDETEVPEGRQNMAQLNVEMQEVGTKMLETLFAKVLKANESRLKYDVNVELTKGKVNGLADLTYAGATTPPTLNNLMTYQMNDWGKLFRGTVDVKADKAALPEGAAEFMLADALKNKAIIDASNQYTVSLKLLGDQVELNGKPLSFADLPAEFFSQAPMGSGLSGGATNELGLPPDIMKQIEEKGVTPEILQQIEESDDVSPETLELLKQLQGMPKDMGGEATGAEGSEETTTKEEKPKNP